MGAVWAPASAVGHTVISWHLFRGDLAAHTVTPAFSKLWGWTASAASQPRGPSPGERRDVPPRYAQTQRHSQHRKFHVLTPRPIWFLIAIPLPTESYLLILTYTCFPKPQVKRLNTQFIYCIRYFCFWPVNKEINHVPLNEFQGKDIVCRSKMYTSRSCGKIGQKKLKSFNQAIWEKNKWKSCLPIWTTSI